MFGPERSIVRLFVNCDEKTGIPLLDEDEEMLFTKDHLGVAFRDTDPIVDTVALYVTSKRVILIGNHVHLAFDVPYIILHAVTRDPASYPLPCLYCQLDYDDEEEEDGDVDGDVDGDDGESENIDDEGEEASASAAVEAATTTIEPPIAPLLIPKGEMFLVPNDETDLMSIFDAFSKAALLNPGDEEDDDDDDFGGLIYNQDEVLIGSEQARALERLESVFVIPSDGQNHDGGVFDDAEDSGSSGLSKPHP